MLLPLWKRRRAHWQAECLGFAYLDVSPSNLPRMQQWPFAVVPHILHFVPQLLAKVPLGRSLHGGRLSRGGAFYNQEIVWRLWLLFVQLSCHWCRTGISIEQALHIG